MPSQLVPFLGVVTLLTLTPGPDMALVVRNGLRGGRAAAWWTGLGCCTGIAVHATLAVLGLSAVLAASARAFTVVELAGAAYLVWLGAKALWATRPGTGHALARVRAGAAEHSFSIKYVIDNECSAVRRRDGYRQGLGTNLLNPKIALLFLTLLPQFVAAGEPRLRTTAELAVLFLVIAVVWWRLFSLAVGTLGGWLRGPAGVWVERATGVVLVGLGVKLAAGSR